MTVTRRTRQSTLESWWATIAQILAFFLGAYLLYQQATAPNPPGAQVWICAAALALMGPGFASTAVAVVTGQAPRQTPPQQTDHTETRG